MDPITAAIIGAVAAGLAAGTTDTAKKVVADAYDGLKSLIKRKLGSESKVAQAIADVEANPQSEGRKAVLQEEVTTAKADQDEELVAAANALIEQIKSLPQGQQYIPTITATIQGDQNRQNIQTATGSGNYMAQDSSSINFGQPTPPNTPRS